MSKTKISEFSTTPGNNTDINGINIAEGCAPSGINNAIRELMSDLKEWQSGAMDVYVIPQGTAAAPGIQLYGDLDTGLYGYAANQLGVAVGGASAGYFSSDGWVGNVVATTVDLTNIEVTNIKAKDGTAAITIADSTGVVSVSTQLAVDNLNLSGNTLSSSDTNGNIILAPNGTGDVYIDADTIRVGDSNTNVTITSNGTADLILNTNSGTNSGSITIEDGVNGNIIIAPNGTGQVQITNAALDLTTIEVTNIKAKDGTAAASIADSTGAITVTKDLTANGVTLGKGLGSVLTNTALGRSALAANTVGDLNTAVGNLSLTSNTGGTGNTAVGHVAMTSHQGGSLNTAVGAGSLTANLNGNNNTAIGQSALGTATGSNNTAVGSAAGSLITNGNKNTIIGNYDGNQGGLDIRTASNYIVLSDGDGNPRAYWNGANATFGGTLTATTITGTQVNSDNLRLDGNTLSSTDTNGNIVIAPNGTGQVQLSGALDVTNIEVTNIKAKDGTAALSIADSTGAVTVATALTANGGAVFNENGADVDFRVEGDTDANLIFADASTDRVGIGTNSPAAKLDVNGNANIGSTSSVDTALFVKSSTVTGLVGAQSNYSAWSSGGLTTAMNIGTTTNNGISFGTNNIGRLNLDSSGNLGLGVANPGSRLQVETNGTYVVTLNNTVDDARIELQRAGTQFGQLSAGNNFFNIVASGASTAIRFLTNSGSTQAMTLDASGGLLVGITSNANSYRVIFQGKNTTTTLDGEAVLNLFDGNANNEYNNLRFATSSDGPLAVIGAKAVTGGAYPSSVGQLEFGVQNGASTNTVMTLDASGNLLVGITSAIAGARMSVVGDVADTVIRFRNDNASSPGGVDINYAGAAPNGAGNYFFLARDTGGNRFYVQSNGGIANYQGNDTNLSDRREKTNFAPAKSYLDAICAIPVQTFNYIDQSEDDPGLTLGVVAQDVQAVAPELVMESNWGTKDDPKMRLSIYQTDLQYALMKCIQEQQAMINELKAEVAALKGA